ncbi:hypothetical protein, partial [Enterococcus lemanii]
MIDVKKIGKRAGLAFLFLLLLVMIIIFFPIFQILSMLMMQATFLLVQIALVLIVAKMSIWSILWVMGKKKISMHKMKNIYNSFK